MRLFVTNSLVLWGLLSLTACEEEPDASVDVFSPDKQTVERLSGEEVDQESIPKPLAIVISPNEGQAYAGDLIALSAIGLYPYDGRKDLTAVVTWSTNNDRAGFSDESPSFLKTLSPGEVIISASFKEIDGFATLQINEPRLERLQLIPDLTAVELERSGDDPIAKTIPLTARGVYSNHTVTDESKNAKWASSNKTVATVNSSGHITFKQPGSVTISATIGSIKASQEIGVSLKSKQLSHLGLSPAVVSIPLGLDENLILTAFYNDGTSTVVTESSTWSSSNSSIVTVDDSAGNKGFITAAAMGSAVVTASFGGKTASVNVSVSGALLTSLSLNPGDLSLPNGVPQQFELTGHFSDGSSYDFTSAAAWSSASPSIASIGDGAGDSGLAETINEGTSVITAEFGGLTASSTLTVTSEILDSINITGADSLANGTTIPLTATGVYTDGSTADLTTLVNWVSQSSSLLTVSNTMGSQGEVTGKGVGNVNIFANLDGISGSKLLSVTPAEVVSISVQPAVAGSSVPLGYGKQFIALATFTDSNQQDVTASAAWTIDVSSGGMNHAANVSNGGDDPPGYAQSIAEGNTGIIATYEGHSASATLTVTPKEVESLAVSAVTTKFTIGETHQITATATYTDGSIADVTDPSDDPDLEIVWSATDSVGYGTVIFMDNTTNIGEATANLEGGATIVATLTSQLAGVKSKSIGVSVHSTCISGESHSYYCIYGGGPGESCDTVCSTGGGSYNQATQFAYGSSASNSSLCIDAIRQLGNGDENLAQGTTYTDGVGCAKIAGAFVTSNARVADPATTASAFNPDASRICACTQ